MYLHAWEAILRKPVDIVGQTGVAFVDTLFANFCDYAKRYYTYNATKVPTSAGPMLLNYPEGSHKVVDCGGLAGAFALLVKDKLGLFPESKCVGGGAPFATKQYSQCFDPRIVGNIRSASQHFAAFRRCAFSTHAFVKVGVKFYDPCLLTTYGTEDEVRSWLFEGAKNKPLWPVLYRVQNNPGILLIRIPDAVAPPYGFASSFLQVETKDLDKAIYKEAFGVEKPMWQLLTKSVKQLLNAAGLPSWPDLC